MSKIALLFTVVATICCSAACTDPTPTPKTEVVPAKTVDPVIVGNDADEHGCKGSAGYQWSVLKNDCIKVFEAGIRLEAKAKDLDKSLSAFVVFKSETDEKQAEIFLPSSKTTMLLPQVKDSGAGTWQNETYTLTQWKGMYALENNKKELLYQGMATH